MWFLCLTCIPDLTCVWLYAWPVWPVSDCMSDLYVWICLTSVSDQMSDCVSDCMSCVCMCDLCVCVTCVSDCVCDLCVWLCMWPVCLTVWPVCLTSDSVCDLCVWLYVTCVCDLWVWLYVWPVCLTVVWPVCLTVCDLCVQDRYVLGCWLFWLGLLLIPFTCLIRDFAWKV